MSLTRTVKLAGGKVVGCPECGTGIAVRFADNIQPIGRVVRIRLETLTIVRAVVIKCPKNGCTKVVDVSPLDKELAPV